MKRVVVFLVLFAAVLPLVFSQQKMDVNGDGLPEIVYSRSGKKYFNRIEFDFNNDGKYDIALIIDDDTGRYLSLDAVRTTWPIPENYGTQQWLNEKKSAAQTFWKNRTENDAICDLCNASVRRNGGCLLNSQDILANKQVINSGGETIDAFSRLLNGGNENYDPVMDRLSFWQGIFMWGGINTSWLLCDECLKKYNISGK